MPLIYSVYRDYDGKWKLEEVRARETKKMYVLYASLQGFKYRRNLDKDEVCLTPEAALKKAIDHTTAHVEHSKNALQLAEADLAALQAFAQLLKP